MAGYVALAWGVFFFSIITLVLYPYGERHDLVRRRISVILNQNKTKDVLDEELNKPLSERFLRPALKVISAQFSRFLPQNPDANSSTKRKLQSDKLKKMLHQAGVGMSISEYSFFRFIIIAIAGALCGLLSFSLGFGIRSVLGILFGFYAGYTLMRFHLTSKISKRRRLMEQQLPDILDLLSINVEAGLGFEQALSHVIAHFDGPIVDELMITSREMTMGRPRREALTLLADRCDLDDMRSFVGAIVQAENLGISIKNVLRTQALAMRASRRSKVQEKAMKISVKILLPMVAFIFPVIFIVLMGPAAVKIYEMFAG